MTEASPTGPIVSTAAGAVRGFWRDGSAAFLGIPFAEPPEADLAGTWVAVSNGARDAMIPPALTRELVTQLSDRGAAVTEVHHGGGHQIDPNALVQIRQLIATHDAPPEETP